MRYNGTFTSKVQNFMNIIDARIRAVFNRDFFGVYEGIIESINDEQSTLAISVPALNAARFENCRVVIPAVSTTSKLMPTFAIGSHVIIMFTSFSLDNPVVMGQLSPINVIYSSLDATIMSLTNGAGSISIDSGGNISITGNNVILNGTTITANGEDLTDDDIGVL